MKLLIYFGFIQIIFAFTLGVQNISAEEVADSYRVRYERWLKQKPQFISVPKSKYSNQNKSSKIQNRKVSEPVLPKILPKKIEVSSEPVVVSKTQQVGIQNNKVQSTKASSVESELRSRPIVRKLALDAREEFLNNIPKDNEQVQSLLTMVDHTKVYFSINQNAPLKDLFKDERFREIYTEEMKPDTRKLTYYFFKGYQDHQRMPNEPVQKSLNRNVLINRERIDSYLETTGIKSKLTRSLQGSYPKIPKPPTPVVIPVESTDSSGANLGTN